MKRIFRVTFQCSSGDLFPTTCHKTQLFHMSTSKGVACFQCDAGPASSEQPTTPQCPSGYRPLGNYRMSVIYIDKNTARHSPTLPLSVVLRCKGAAVITHETGTEHCMINGSGMSWPARVPPWLNTGSLAAAGQLQSAANKTSLTDGL